MIKKFKKRPITKEIQAIQYDGSYNSLLELSEFANHWLDKINEMITTPNGAIKFFKNDWIIKGSESDFYPCKPDVFEDTYEEI